MGDHVVGVEDERTRAAKSAATLVYVLQGAGFFVAITFIAAVIVNYVKLDDVRGTWVESHFRWQIRTFWFGLLWGTLGALLILVAIGWVVLIASGVWVLYRIIRGFLALADGRAMYADTVTA